MGKYLEILESLRDFSGVWVEIGIDPGEEDEASVLSKLNRDYVTRGIRFGYERTSYDTISRKKLVFFVTRLLGKDVSKGEQWLNRLKKKVLLGREKWEIRTSRVTLDSR